MSAAQWRLMAGLVGAVSQLGVGMVLARLLTPANFGVLALASIVIGFVQPFGDFGLGAALVQRTVLTDRHVRVAFTLSVLLGVTIAGVLAGAAPLAAAVMRNPEVAPLLRVLSLGFALRGTAIVSGALLRRRLEFKRQFFIDSGSLVGYCGVAIVLAVRGYGVWSLVWGSLCQTSISAAAQFAVVRHSARPLMARREVGDLLDFGVGSALGAVVNYMALNGDNFVVGRTLGAASLGLYNRAYMLMNVPYTYAASAMTAVLFPAFAQIQDERARLQRGYLLLTRLAGIVAAPTLGTLAIGAPHVVPALFGPQWTGAVVPLQILCLAGYFRALYHIGGVVAQSVGRVYADLWRQFIYAFLVIAGTLVGSRYGLAGVAVAVDVAILYMFAATSQLALGATGLSWRSYFRAQVSAAVTAVLTCGVAAVLRLLLEREHASSPVIASVLLAGAGVAWATCLLWNLGDPAFDQLRGRLPPMVIRLSGGLRAAVR